MIPELTLAPRELAAVLAAVRGELLAAAISLMPVNKLIPVKLGLEVALDRADLLLAEDYAGGRWHRVHDLQQYTELERLRYPPHGDRSAWIRNGPPGHVNYVPRREAAA